MKSEVVEINSKILRDHSTINNYFTGILDLTHGIMFLINN